MLYEVITSSDVVSFLLDILVITSYSIHYTKLYEQKYYDTCSEMNDKIFQTARFDVPKFQYKEIIKDIRKKLNCVVITSYSIHYTKLYDGLIFQTGGFLI